VLFTVVESGKLKTVFQRFRVWWRLISWFTDAEGKTKLNGPFFRGTLIHLLLKVPLHIGDEIFNV
jgi:hypothetical protein